MSQPVGLYTVQVPPGGIMVPALPQGAVAMVSSIHWMRQ